MALVATVLELRAFSLVIALLETVAGAFRCFRERAPDSTSLDYARTNW